MIATTAYDEVINFIATGTSPEKVIAFRPSTQMQARVSEFNVERKKYRIKC